MQSSRPSPSLALAPLLSLAALRDWRSDSLPAYTRASWLYDSHTKTELARVAVVHDMQGGYIGDHLYFGQRVFHT
jgi:hypothetical protein